MAKYVKGQSGNPRGRPKSNPEFVKACQKSADMALRVLQTIAEHGETEAARVSAAREILDRAYGKPIQESGVKVDGAIVLSWQK